MLLLITFITECSQMISKTKMFFKFNKYSFIETFWSSSALVMDLLMLRHWNWRPSQLWYADALFAFFAFFTFFGFYRAFESWRTYPQRKSTYIKATNIFLEHGVSKSLLYHIEANPCTQTVALQLSKDFNVKLEKITD